MKKVLLATALLCFSSAPVLAEGTHYTVTGGIPYFVIPEISYSPNAEQRWFANYKLGLDDGFSAGFEQAVSDNNRHALGIFGGALGVRRSHVVRCNNESQNGEQENIGDAFDELGCTLAVEVLETIYNNRTVNGVGLSYSYNRHGLSERGLRVRLEFGYGRIEDANFDKNGVTGGIAVGYQF
ncbi:hypothetical protein L9G74_04675 [Shewanella sp. C32]|uniref:Outer membrane protein beta-barrel domain-containing protein n=1 Tax=Shewanella electrica TaxID=515560 RepID=A0ABT2FHB9_9GAMM|nr:hypothetical protein [Shewanella electrica]MCH1923627.1 hypothetical protein [Shewanella electrica]MCS4555723.1 hypothetical protein [Shewanella electrica]